MTLRSDIAAGPHWEADLELAADGVTALRLTVHTCGACREMSYVDKETGLCRRCWRCYRFSPDVTHPELPTADIIDTSQYEETKTP